METCIVGCKLPHGLIIDLNPQYDEKRRLISSDRVTLKGANSAVVTGGFGVTPGVNKAAFVAWVADHKNAPYIRNGAIFVATDAASVKSNAAEKRAERTGFEQLDPTKKTAYTAALDMDDAAMKVYNQQRAENPMLARQHDTLND